MEGSVKCALPAGRGLAAGERDLERLSLEPLESSEPDPEHSGVLEGHLESVHERKPRSVECIEGWGVSSS